MLLVMMMIPANGLGILARLEECAAVALVFLHCLVLLIVANVVVVLLHLNAPHLNAQRGMLLIDTQHCSKIQ